MNCVTSALIDDQSAGPFGSNTAHFRLCWRLCSMKSVSLRTGTYLKGLSSRSAPASVRVPQLT